MEDTAWMEALDEATRTQMKESAQLLKQLTQASVMGQLDALILMKPELTPSDIVKIAGESIGVFTEKAFLTTVQHQVEALERAAQRIEQWSPTGNDLIEVERAAQLVRDTINT